MKNMLINKAFSLFEVAVVIVAICGVGVMFIPAPATNNGPADKVMATVGKTFVKGTAMLVATDKGCFEVSNAVVDEKGPTGDELFGRLEEGMAYEFSARGRRGGQGHLYPMYPYIVAVKPAALPKCEVPIP